MLLKIAQVVVHAGSPAVDFRAATHVCPPPPPPTPPNTPAPPVQHGTLPGPIACNQLFYRSVVRPPNRQSYGVTQLMAFCTNGTFTPVATPQTVDYYTYARQLGYSS